MIAALPCPFSRQVVREYAECGVAPAAISYTASHPNFHCFPHPGALVEGITSPTCELNCVTGLEERNLKQRRSGDLILWERTCSEFAGNAYIRLRLQPLRQWSGLCISDFRHRLTLFTSSSQSSEGGRAMRTPLPV